MRHIVLGCLSLLAVVGWAACDNGGGGGDEGDRSTWTIHAGENATAEAVTAFTNAQPGDTIYFPEGVYQLNSTLTLQTDDVRIHGDGPDASVLSFLGQDTGNGHNGIYTFSSDLVIEDLAIEDTVGDGIKTHDGENVVIRNTRVEWPRGPHPENGPYAIYPVNCHNVLIEDNLTRGASDSGIYVGQTDNIIVRRNRVEENVTGIEIECSSHADVYENTVTRNTGGILVFDLPDLPTQGGNTTRVFNNEVSENNTPNFAPEGNVVRIVPRGTGIFIFANNNVEVFGNDVRDNKTVNFLVASYSTMALINGLTSDDPRFDPDPETINIHDNTVTGGGDDPGEDVGELLSTLLGTEALPDLVWDGNIDEDKRNEDGSIPEALRLCFKNNGDVTAVNMDVLDVLGGAVYGLEQFDCSHPALSPIVLPEGMEE